MDSRIQMLTNAKQLETIKTYAHRERVYSFIGRNMRTLLCNIQSRKAKNDVWETDLTIFEYNIDSIIEELDKFCNKTNFGSNHARENQPHDRGSESERTSLQIRKSRNPLDPRRLLQHRSDDAPRYAWRNCQLATYISRSTLDTHHSRDPGEQLCQETLFDLSPERESGLPAEDECRYPRNFHRVAPHKGLWSGIDKHLHAWHHQGVTLSQYQVGVLHGGCGTLPNSTATHRQPRGVEFRSFGRQDRGLTHVFRLYT